MIVDTSALVAVITGEPDAERYLDAMVSADELGVPATALVEASEVLQARQGDEAVADLHALLAELEVEVLPIDEGAAREAADAWRRFGKGRHPAGLNFGDVFSYALARATGRPLLFKGDHFTQTDVGAALR